MGELRCVDGSVLSVAAVPCRDRAGNAYEITLELARNSAPFAAVGERCGHRLAELAERVRAARGDPELAAAWPDPDDRFPGPAGLPDFQPGDREFFSLRSRDRGDQGGTGELRCTLRSAADWIGECAGTGPARGSGAGATMTGYQIPRQRAWPGPRAAAGQHSISASPGPAGRAAAAVGGAWRLTRRAVLEAWGIPGIGLRAVLTSAELVRFLDTVLREPGTVVLAGSAPVGETTVSVHDGEPGSPSSRQRGRVPDGSARSRLPALRAQARGVAVAERDPQACRGDVRR